MVMVRVPAAGVGGTGSDCGHHGLLTGAYEACEGIQIPAGRPELNGSRNGATDAGQRCRRPRERPDSEGGRIVALIDNERLLAGLRVPRQRSIREPEAIRLVEDVDDSTGCDDPQRSDAGTDENRLPRRNPSRGVDVHARRGMGLPASQTVPGRYEARRRTELSLPVVMVVARRKVLAKGRPYVWVGGFGLAAGLKDALKFVNRWPSKTEHPRLPSSMMVG